MASVVQAHLVTAHARKHGWALLQEDDKGEYVHRWWMTPIGLIIRVVADENDVWSVNQETSWEPRRG